MWSKGLHDIVMQGDGKQFERFLSSPLCSYSSNVYRGSEVKDCLMNVEVEGKVSPAMLGSLFAASARYQHKEQTSTKRQVMSLSSRFYFRKGFLFADREKPTYLDKGMAFDVQGIEIGMEEILIVTLEFESYSKSTQDTVEVKVKILFFTISAKMESFSQSASVKGCVEIDHYSSKRREWMHLEFPAHRYEEALAEVKRIEAVMSTTPDIVKKTPFDQLPRMRYLVRPCPRATNRIALYIELNNTINTIRLRLAQLKASTGADSGGKIEKVEQSLEEIQSVSLEDFSWNDLDDFVTRFQNKL